MAEIEAAALARFTARPTRSRAFPDETPAEKAARWARGAAWDASECDRMARVLSAGVGVARMPASEVAAWLECERDDRLALWLGARA